MKQDYITFDTAMLAKDNNYKEEHYSFYKLTEEDNIVHEGYSNNIFFHEVRVNQLFNKN